MKLKNQQLGSKKLHLFYILIHSTRIRSTPMLLLFFVTANRRPRSAKDEAAGNFPLGRGKEQKLHVDLDHM